MGYVANNYPELFGTLIFDRPFLDVTNSMMDSTLTLTTMEYKEWYGNMMADKLATNASKKSKEEFYNLKGVNSKSKSFFPSAILP